MPAAWRELSRLPGRRRRSRRDFQAAKDAYDKKAQELKGKYGEALAGLKFGHLGAYGEVSKGTFHREFARSWGTNIAQDIGVTYPGEVKEKGGGGLDVTEYPSIEELPESLARRRRHHLHRSSSTASRASRCKQVLDSALWKNLPAVKAGKVFRAAVHRGGDVRAPRCGPSTRSTHAFAPLLDR